jgi:hypothetical protein
MRDSHKRGPGAKESKRATDEIKCKKYARVNTKNYFNRPYYMIGASGQRSEAAVRLATVLAAEPEPPSPITDTAHAMGQSARVLVVDENGISRWQSACEYPRHRLCCSLTAHSRTEAETGRAPLRETHVITTW